MKYIWEKEDIYRGARLCLSSTKLVLTVICKLDSFPNGDDKVYCTVTQDKVSEPFTAEELAKLLTKLNAIPLCTGIPIDYTKFL